MSPAAVHGVDWAESLKALANPESTSNKPVPVAGTRGLGQSSDDNVDTEARNYAAVEELEQVIVSPADVDKFIAEENLK